MSQQPLQTRIEILLFQTVEKIVRKAIFPHLIMSIFFETICISLILS